jgi:hypothetical protein
VFFEEIHSTNALSFPSQPPPVLSSEFRTGNLTLSKDLSSKTDLHILADSTTLLDLSLLKIKFGLPYFFDKNGFKILKKY